MKKLQQNFCAFTVCIGLFFLVSCGGKKDDDQLQKDVSQTITSNDNNKPSYPNITSTVKDGIVTLSGQCEGANCGDSVIARVKDVEGVKDVVNNMQQTVAPTDLTLRTSVQSIISKYQGVQADVAAGVIVLRGTIQRDQIQPLMNELSSLEATKIDNQLAIQQ